MTGNLAEKRGIQWGMAPLSLLCDCFSRAFRRKWAPIALSVLFLAGFLCGAALFHTPAFYDYHLRIVDRFLDRVCYSDRSVVIIFFERTAGNVLFLVLLCLGGLHPAALFLPTAAIAFRAYLFGGSFVALFSVYRVAGGLVALALYLPVHLLLDAVFLCAASLAFSRAFSFRFCAGDLKEWLLDLLLLSAAVAAVCLFEAFLLAVLFHPIGILL